MPLGSMTVPVLAPWIEPAIDIFGTGRCMFASNFPVDGTHGSLHDLFTSFSLISGGLPDDERELLFAGNAERIYRC
jgi:predicted TIM-barrel fold metal-dependent hydrolase